MYARISTDSGDMSTFLQHFESGAAALEGWNGLDHVHLMVNEETGRAVALSVWADEASMRASDAGADEMRTRVSERSGVKTDSVEHFRLVRTVQGPASKGMLPLIATGP
jgi:heme-degrading monooxygenase HmoA